MIPEELVAKVSTAASFGELTAAFQVEITPQDSTPSLSAGEDSQE
ncbi:MAG: hypothetical protein AAGJ79_04035 [Verrucomicrobiota bacterium]